MHCTARAACPQNQNMHAEDRCNEFKTPLEVDILASLRRNHVSYITKKPRINMVCGCTLQNKEKYHIIDTLDACRGKMLTDGKPAFSTWLRLIVVGNLFHNLRLVTFSKLFHMFTCDQHKS